MKLNELKTITPDDLSVQKTQKGGFRVKQELAPPHHEEIGGGKFAKTYSDPNEPFTATKLVHTVRDNDLKKDAYYKYVSALAKNDRMSGNPFFPKIYSIKVVKDREGTMRYAVNMERLMDFDTLSEDELDMLGNKMFFNFKDFQRDMYARFEGKYKYGSKELLSAAIMFAMHKVIYAGSKVQTYIKDPHLRGALTIIGSLVKAPKDGGRGVNPDMHNGNVMVRRGPGGPQLVITDPVY